MHQSLTQVGNLIGGQGSGFLPVKVLSRVFRGKFLAVEMTSWPQETMLRRPLCRSRRPLEFVTLLRYLHRHDCVFYAKPAFGGPLQVLRYLGRYTHRVAISNHRLLAFQR